MDVMTIREKKSIQLVMSYYPEAIFKIYFI
jgi:hypothetical protein